MAVVRRAGGRGPPGCHCSRSWRLYALLHSAVRERRVTRSVLCRTGPHWVCRSPRGATRVPPAPPVGCGVPGRRPYLRGPKGAHPICDRSVRSCWRPWRRQRGARAARNRGAVGPGPCRTVRCRPAGQDGGPDRRARPGQARPDGHPEEGRLPAADRGQATRRADRRERRRPGVHRGQHRQAGAGGRRRARRPQGRRAGGAGRRRPGDLQLGRAGRDPGERAAGRGRGAGGQARRRW